MGNFTTSYRAPALEELYNNGPHIGTITFEVGSQDLENETSDGLDFSLRHQSGRFRFSGDVFYYRVQGPTFVIEYDVTNRSADHVHSVYRDLEHDFGGAEDMAGVEKPRRHPG